MQNQLEAREEAFAQYEAAGLVLADLASQSSPNEEDLRSARESFDAFLAKGELLLRLHADHVLSQAPIDHELLEAAIEDVQNVIAVLHRARDACRILAQRDRGRQYFGGSLENRFASLIASHEQALDAFRNELQRPPLSPAEEAERRIRTLPWAFPRSGAFAVRADHRTSPDVVDFVVREGLETDLQCVWQLLRQAFPGGRDMHMEMEHDPEGEESWVSLRIDVPDDRTVERFAEYMTAVRRVVPRSRANKIRLFYNVL